MAAATEAEVLSTQDLGEQESEASVTESEPSRLSTYGLTPEPELVKTVVDDATENGLADGDNVVGADWCSKPVVVDNIEKIIRCPVCLEDKQLHFLDCQHRCCKFCLDKLEELCVVDYEDGTVNETCPVLRCPVCRRTHVVPELWWPICLLTGQLRECVRGPDTGAAASATATSLQPETPPLRLQAAATSLQSDTLQQTAGAVEPSLQPDTPQLRARVEELSPQPDMYHQNASVVGRSTQIHTPQQSASLVEASTQPLTDHVNEVMPRTTSDNASAQGVIQMLEASTALESVLLHMSTDHQTNLNQINRPDDRPSPQPISTSAPDLSSTEPINRPVADQQPRRDRQFVPESIGENHASAHGEEVNRTTNLSHTVTSPQYSHFKKFFSKLLLLLYGTHGLVKIVMQNISFMWLAIMSLSMVSTISRISACFHHANRLKALDMTFMQKLFDKIPLARESQLSCLLHGRVTVLCIIVCRTLRFIAEWRKLRTPLAADSEVLFRNVLYGLAEYELSQIFFQNIIKSGPLVISTEFDVLNLVLMLSVGVLLWFFNSNKEWLSATGQLLFVCHYIVSQTVVMIVRYDNFSFPTEKNYGGINPVFMAIYILMAWYPFNQIIY